MDDIQGLAFTNYNSESATTNGDSGRIPVAYYTSIGRDLSIGTVTANPDLLWISGVSSNTGKLNCPKLYQPIDITAAMERVISSGSFPPA